MGSKVRVPGCGLKIQFTQNLITVCYTYYILATHNLQSFDVTVLLLHENGYA